MIWQEKIGVIVTLIKSKEDKALEREEKEKKGLARVTGITINVDDKDDNLDEESSPSPDKGPSPSPSDGPTTNVVSIL